MGHNLPTNCEMKAQFGLSDAEIRSEEFILSEEEIYIWVYDEAPEGYEPNFVLGDALLDSLKLRLAPFHLEDHLVQGSAYPNFMPQCPYTDLITILPNCDNPSQMTEVAARNGLSSLWVTSVTGAVSSACREALDSIGVSINSVSPALADLFSLVSRGLIGRGADQSAKRDRILMADPVSNKERTLPVGIPNRFVDVTRSNGEVKEIRVVEGQLLVCQGCCCDNTERIPRVATRGDQATMEGPWHSPTHSLNDYWLSRSLPVGKCRVDSIRWRISLAPFDQFIRHVTAIYDYRK